MPPSSTGAYIALGMIRSFQSGRALAPITPVAAQQGASGQEGESDAGEQQKAKAGEWEITRVFGRSRGPCAGLEARHCVRRRGGPARALVARRRAFVIASVGTSATASVGASAIVGVGASPIAWIGAPAIV